MPEKQQIRSPAFWKSRANQIYSLFSSFSRLSLLLLQKKKKKGGGIKESNHQTGWNCAKIASRWMSKRIPWGPAPNAPSLMARWQQRVLLTFLLPVKTHLPSKSHMFDRKSASLAIPRGRSILYVSSNTDDKRDNFKTSTWKDLLGTQEPFSTSTTPVNWN